MASSQLVTTQLTAFDEKPENYWAWTSSFQSAIAGLDLSPGEELDDKQSSEHACRKKAVNMRDPLRGLMMIWERLEVTSPEAIEQSLFTKLENVPKVSYKDPHKLRELLMVVEAVKLGGSLPGLSYVNTSRGVCSIAEKLSFGISGVKI